MPWPPAQRTAIFLSEQRRHGTSAAKRLMHKHGYGGKTAATRAVRRRKK